MARHDAGLDEAKSESQAVITTSTSYKLIVDNLERSLSTAAERPQIARETEYYLANIGNVKTIDEFLGDDRLFRYAMKAHGLEEMAYAKGFMKKLLDEGIDASDSFANSLSDPRYKDFATTFNFVQFESATTAFDRAGQGTADRFIRQTLEEDAGAENEGVRLALYFARRAPDIESAYGLLGDRALLGVVQTALGLSPTTSLLDIDRQAEMIEDRLPIEDLADPEKLGKFLERFASLWDLQNPAATVVVPNILIGRTLQMGIGADLLASLQNLKLGGR